MTDIKINGTKTIIQDTIPKPFIHNKFNNNVKNTMTINLMRETLYNPLYVSIMICVIEKTKYINAGGHIDFKKFNIIYINII